MTATPTPATSALSREVVLRIVATSVLVAVATLASFRALTVLIGPGQWTRTGTAFVLALTLVTGGTRLLLERGREARPGRHDIGFRGVVPTLVGLVVGAWGLLAVFGGPTSRGIDLAISGASIDRLLARLGAGQRLVAEEVAPIDSSFPLALIAVAGTILVLLATDLVVAGLRFPSAAALPLLALWIPPLVIEGSIPPPVFVVTVVALLLLVAVDNPHRVARRRGAVPAPVGPAARTLRAGGILGATAAIAVLALVAGTAAGAIPQVLSSPWSSFFTSAGPTVRLASDLDMEENLGARSQEVALTYEFPQEIDQGGASTGIGPLRMFTLTGFDGKSWRRGDSRQGPPVDAGQVLWPDDPGAGPAEPRTVAVTLRTLRDEKLVLPTEPRSVDVDGEWFYDDSRDEVTGNSATTPGMTYSFEVFARDLTADALRASTGDDLDDPNVVEVPESAHRDDVRALAEEIVAGTTTRYDAAVALQSYFRDGSNFTYSTEVPEGATDDTVWNFLQDREGYCVQFATSMTMMARTVGIPARLAVGFLPGERASDNVFQVTGKDSHAWPELYFPGQGWVRFEPTPAVQAGPVPAWADPLLGPASDDSTPVPGDAATSQAGPNATPGAVQSTAPAPGVGSGSLGDEASSGRGWSMGLIALVAVLVLSGLGWLVARRRGGASAEPDVESTWTDLVRQLDDLGISWHGSVTLRQVPAVVAAQVAERTGRHLPDATTDALVALATEVELERYARTWSPPPPGDLAALRDKVVAGVRDELSDRPARVDGPNALPVG
ncbi:transglutaminaseTgpA domain-containing protein [Oerskovia sp. NPDC056781]|uniref:transglutaminase family protein n=1 Tax=Oerskovia sp. NPDC056781 TaxID=3345942 RepID=UPI00366E7FBC